MNIKRLVVDFVRVFAVTLVVSAIVTLLGNFIVHRTLTIGWQTSFGCALLFGIILAWTGTRGGKGRQQGNVAF